MFHSARLKLTAWYVLVAIIITTLFSILGYSGLRFELERGLQRQQIIFDKSSSSGGPPNIIFHRVDPDLQEELRQRLLLRILYIDFAIVLVAAAGGYLLAGRTLKPIQKMVDEQHRFITDASHELRTPITSMRTELEASLLAREISSNDAKVLLQSSLEEVIKLQTLSDGLLTLAQHQKQNKSQTFANVALRDSMTSALKKVAPLAKKKRITIINKTKDAIISGSKDHLSELFVILLDNAIKYSSTKSLVTITSRKIDHKVKIDVIDTGIGIDEKDIPNIFERFYRSDKSRQKADIGGYGLGLAIASQIITDHKGSISVASTVNKGTTFSVVLPIASH